MSVTHETLVSGGARGPRAPRARSKAVALAACALVALSASEMGCAYHGDAAPDVERDEEVVSAGTFASTFSCASAFGQIGAAIYMTGEIVVPNGEVVSVATTPAGSPAIDCTLGGTVVLDWEPIKIEVPVSGGMTGKLILQDFEVFGTPGALLPGECVAPTLCHPGTVDPQCADDTILLEFEPKVCTVAAFAAGACQLSQANAIICGTV